MKINGDQQISCDVCTKVNTCEEVKFAKDIAGLKTLKENLTEKGCPNYKPKEGNDKWNNCRSNV